MSSDSDPSQPSGLSGADAVLLEHYGRDIMQDAVGMVAESIFCSAYGIFFAFAVYSILRKGLKSRSRVIMLIVVVYLYAASVTLWAMDFAIASLSGIHSLLMVPDTPIPDRGDLANANRAKFLNPAEAFFMINMVIADGVLIWRTWAICQRRKFALFIPCTLLLVSFVFAVIDISNSYTNAPHNSPGSGQICPAAATIAWAFSLATNVGCTILVGFKAWQHRKMMRELDLIGQPCRMSAEKILLVFVESGFIYCLLWLSQLISYLGFTRASPWYYAYAILGGLGNQMTGMYPTLLIVIVNFQRTFWDEETSKISNGALNTLPWSVKRPRPTDATESGGDVHREMVIDITHENSQFSDPDTIPPTKHSLKTYFYPLHSGMYFS